MMAASQKSFSARLARVLPVASRTLFLEFDLPDPGFDFQPGQAISLSFPENGSPADRTRIFSLCTAPFEIPRIGIATRLTGSVFKENLVKAKTGQDFILSSPFGEFLLPDPSEQLPFVFMAGGIGITPFRSMIREHLHRKLPQTIFLMTVNRTEEDTPFLSECRAWAGEAGLTWIPVLSQEESVPSSSVLPSEAGPASRHRQERIEEALRSIVERAGPNPHFYIAGPPGMVDSLEQTLLGQFLVPSEKIKTDLFFGYGPH